MVGTSTKIAPVGRNRLCCAGNRCGPPMRAASDSPNIREEQKVMANGFPEVWRLEWESSPKTVCGLEDLPSAVTCPCSGFAYGESGQLDLIRSRNGREIERLKLAKYFADHNGAILQRWKPQEGDSEEQGSESEAFLTQVRARPVVKVVSS